MTQINSPEREELTSPSRTVRAFAGSVGHRAHEIVERYRDRKGLDAIVEIVIDGLRRCGHAKRQNGRRGSGKATSGPQTSRFSTWLS